VTNIGFTIINDLAGGVANEWIGYLTFGDQNAPELYGRPFGRSGASQMQQQLSH